MSEFAPGPQEASPIHVMAGLLVDGVGRVLLAQRPSGKHLAGLWEFPGGKLEIGEAPWQGLRRELREELGVEALHGAPLIRIPWRYGERALVLDAWQVHAWHGEPASMEQQALRWIEPVQIDPTQLTPADRPILQALRLPPTYGITPADCPIENGKLLEARIEHALTAGSLRLLQLRLPLWPMAQVRELAAGLLPLLRRHDAHLLLNGDIEGARALGVGVHLPARQLAELTERPLPWTQLVAASCHDADELAAAMRLHVDFATLSPVHATPSHPDTTTLGWPVFQTVVAEAALPVYAMGGVSAAELDQARRHGAHGVAGIRGFWPSA